MKRSNLFLAATTGLLAIASFAFAKTRTFRPAGFCLTRAGVCATPTASSNWTVTGGSAAAKCKASGHTTQTVVTAACIQKLKVISTPD